MTVNAKVASAYVDLVARTEAFHKALDDAGGAMRKFAQTMREETEKSREAVRLLNESLGVGIPRGLQSIISKLPAVTTAMNLAFDAVVVIGVIHVVSDLTEKIVKFAERTEEAGRKHAEAWRGVQQPMRSANDELQLTNDKLENAIAKMEGRPQNGLKQAIDEAIASADKLGEKLTSDVAKIAEVLKGEQVGFMGRLAGNAGDKDVTERARALQSKLEEIQTREASTDWSSMKPKDVDAERKRLSDEYRGALDADVAWTKNELAKIAYRQVFADMGGMGIGPDPSKRRDALTDYRSGLGQMSRFTSLSDTNTADAAHTAALEAAKGAADEAEKAAQKRLKVFETEFAQENAQQKMSIAQERSYWESKLLSFKTGSAEYLAVEERYSHASQELARQFAAIQKSTRGENSPYEPSGKEQDQMAERAARAATQSQDLQAKNAASLASLNAELEINKVHVDLATGAIGAHEAALEIAKAHYEETTAKVKALNDELAKLRAQTMYDAAGNNMDPENENKQQEVRNQLVDVTGKAQIQKLKDTVDAFNTTFKGVIDSIFDEIVKKSQEAGQQLAQFGKNFIDSINAELAKGVTGGKMDFHKVFQSGSQQLAKIGLEKAEGIGAQLLGQTGLGKMLGIGGKRDGHTAQSALFVEVVGAGGGSGQLAGLNLSSIFGKTQPTVTGPNGQLVGAAASVGGGGISGFIQSLLSGAFGGGHALGGNVAAGIPIDVGELGRERFTPMVAGTITPHSEMGSGQTVMHIDARGTDPALTRENFQRALAATHAQAVHDAAQVMAERQRRMPR